MNNRYIIINKNKIQVIEKTLSNTTIKRIYDLNNLPSINYNSTIINTIDINIEKCSEMQVVEAECINNIILYNVNIIKNDSINLKENPCKQCIMLEFNNDDLIIHIYIKDIKYVINKSEIKAELIPQDCILLSDNQSFILLSNFLTF